MFATEGYWIQECVSWWILIWNCCLRNLKVIWKQSANLHVVAGCCTDSFSQNMHFFVIICTPKVKTTLWQVLMMLENQLTDLTTSAIIPFQFSALLKMVNMSSFTIHLPWRRNQCWPCDKVIHNIESFIVIISLFDSIQHKAITIVHWYVWFWV